MTNVKNVYGIVNNLGLIDYPIITYTVNSPSPVHYPYCNINNLHALWIIQVQLTIPVLLIITYTVNSPSPVHYLYHCLFRLASLVLGTLDFSIPCKKIKHSDDYFFVLICLAIWVVDLRFYWCFFKNNKLVKT